MPIRAKGGFVPVGENPDRTSYDKRRAGHQVVSDQSCTRCADNVSGEAEKPQRGGGISAGALAMYAVLSMSAH